MLQTMDNSPIDPAVANADIAKHWAKRRIALSAVICLTLLLLVSMSLSIGTRNVSFIDIWAGLTGKTDTLSQSAVAVRIPRTCLALIAGAALALSGAMMQGVTRNPLADPGILGVNTGASLAVVIGIVWFNIDSAYAYLITAIIGASATAVFVYIIGTLGRGGATPLKLALSGTATSVAFSSLVIAVVLPRADIAGSVRSWQVGGVGGASFDVILPAIPIVLLGVLIAFLSGRKLNALALGDELAAGLGEKVVLTRIFVSFGAIILCGAATAICGPIGFVGLMVPHIFRLAVGNDYRWLLPLSALGGAALLTGSDIVGRLVSRPSELEVGIVTAFIGAPYFIWMVRGRRVRDL
jgi:iron complex transport system permease protein